MASAGNGGARNECDLATDEVSALRQELAQERGKVIALETALATEKGKSEELYSAQIVEPASKRLKKTLTDTLKTKLAEMSALALANGAEPSEVKKIKCRA